MKNKIALFPLNIVLFPQSKFPLHIFENRYKVLIKDCIDNDKIFGINFVDKDKFSSIGCTAIVEKVVDINEEGEMNIIVMGQKRFLIENYFKTDVGYYEADIEYLKNVNINYDEDVFEKAIELYNQLVLTIYKGSVATVSKFDIRWKDGSSSVSFYMAQKCGLNLQQRQELLEINEEYERLEYVFEYLQEVTPMVREADRVAGIIKGDGYLQ